jgi:hypothetical protein
MLLPVETIPCPHCDAPIRPTATFCLACDTPVTDTDRGLSVATPTPVARSRIASTAAVAATVGVVALLGGAVYGTVHLIHGRKAHAEAQASADVRRAVTVLVRAESGQPYACRTAAALLARSNPRQECLAVLGEDPGARLQDVRLDPARLGSHTGSVRLHATVVDNHGSRPLDQTFDVVDVSGQWRLRWDGKPL